MDFFVDKHSDIVIASEYLGNGTRMIEMNDVAVTIDTFSCSDDTYRLYKKLIDLLFSDDFMRLED